MADKHIGSFIKLTRNMKRTSRLGITGQVLTSTNKPLKTMACLNMPHSISCAIFVHVSFIYMHRMNSIKHAKHTHILHICNTQPAIVTSHCHTYVTDDCSFCFGYRTKAFYYRPYYNTTCCNLDAFITQCNSCWCALNVALYF